MTTTQKITPRVLGIHPSKADASNFYRGLGVFGNIRDIDYVLLNRYSEVKIKYIVPTEALAWNWLHDRDIVIIFRPYGTNFRQAIDVIKNNNKKLWLDFDDNLLRVPEWNPTYNFYKTSMDHDDLLWMIEQADVVTVSTESIKKQWGNYTDVSNIVVLPNAINDYLFKYEYCFSENNIINWRGSSTHSLDLLSVKQQLVNINSKYPEWKLNFIGKNAELLEGEFVYTFQGEKDIVEYLLFIKKLNAKIQIVPLLHNIFNRGKSNLSFLEGTYSGSASIVPNLPEFDIPGALKYDTPEHFQNILEMSINGEIDLEKQYRLSHEYVGDNLLLSHVNKQRVEIIEKLMSGVSK